MTRFATGAKEARLPRHESRARSAWRRPACLSARSRAFATGSASARRSASPPLEHPKRPVAGFDCHRAEVSGQRLWGWARRRFGTPDAFFERFFVANYCPLLFLEDSGRNLPLDKLARDEQRAIAVHCDEALRETVRQLAPRCVLGIGRFAERRAGVALAGMGVDVGFIPHPSPASPAANRGWEAQAEAALAGCGVELEATRFDASAAR